MRQRTNNPTYLIVPVVISCVTSFLDVSHAVCFGCNTTDSRLIPDSNDHSSSPLTFVFIENDIPENDLRRRR